MIRKSIHSIEEVESILKPIILNGLDCRKHTRTINFCGDDIYVFFDRYKLFLQKGMNV